MTSCRSARGMPREGMNATELRLDRSTFIVKCSALHPTSNREYEWVTCDPEVGCSTSSCRETPYAEI